MSVNKKIDDLWESQIEQTTLMEGMKEDFTEIKDSIKDQAPIWNRAAWKADVLWKGTIAIITSTVCGGIAFLIFG